MNQIKRIALLALLVAPPVHALTANEYEKLGRDKAAESYMAGVADALSAVHNSERGSALLCVPDEIRFNQEEVTQHYRDYIRTYPQMRQHLTEDISVADLVLGAYAEQYCGRAAGGAREEEPTPYPLSPLPPPQP